MACRKYDIFLNMAKRKKSETITPFDHALAMVIKESMGEKGVTQMRLAEEADTSQGHVSDLINAKKTMRVAELYGMASALNVPAWMLVKRAEERLVQIVPEDLWGDYDATRGKHRPDPVFTATKEVTHGHS